MKTKIKNLKKMPTKKFSNVIGEVFLKGSVDDFVLLIKRLLTEGTDDDFFACREKFFETLKKHKITDKKLIKWIEKNDFDRKLHEALYK